ncbi:MAG TPA: hypothetical protein VGM30_10645 [Puia sp.]|jgi:hypothetical protein
MVRLFDILNGQVIPSEHCYTLKSLKDIMENHQEDYLTIYLYLFYMTCPNPDLNPFFDVPENDKEELITQEIGASFSLDDEYILNGKNLCEKLYQTPTYRAYVGIKSMLDKLARYMENTPIEHGRDGNLTGLINAAAKFEQIRQSYKGAFKELEEEQKSTVRGGKNLAYDDV